jgi:hypothetical protein
MHAQMGEGLLQDTVCPIFSSRSPSEYQWNEEDRYSGKACILSDNIASGPFRKTSKFVKISVLEIDLAKTSFFVKFDTCFFFNLFIYLFFFGLYFFFI